MKSVTNARKRILQYPEALAKCAAQATVYGKCVASRENIGKSDCMKEFEALQECVKNSIEIETDEVQHCHQQLLQSRSTMEEFTDIKNR